MDTVDLTQLAALVLQRKYLAIGLLAVYTLVRFLRTDVRFFPNLAPRYRALAAVLLGVVAGVLERVSSHVPWKEAIANGAVLGALAILAHFGIVDVARGGKELPVPGFMQAGKPGGGDDKPPPPPKVPGPFIAGLSLVVHVGAWLGVACFALAAWLLVASCGVPPLGPTERAQLARSSLDDARCFAAGKVAGTLPDGGKDKDAGLSAFDACKDAGGGK